MTDIQKALMEELEALYKRGERFLAKDFNGDIYAFRVKPEKGRRCWEDPCVSRSKDHGLCIMPSSAVADLARWEDISPLNIGKYLEKNKKNDIYGAGFIL